jgi:hypothetical protein
MRRPNIPKETLCKSVIVENINNIEQGKELTTSLAILNKSCEFKDFYKKYCNLKYGDEVKEKMKEYRQRPEVKEKMKEYHKEYNKEYRQRPEVKEKRKEIMKEYNQRPEVKEKRKEYYQKKKLKEDTNEKTR